MLTLLRHTVDLIYPPICPLCAGRLPDGDAGPLCETCERVLPRQRPPYCLRCGASLPGRWDAEIACRHCSDRTASATRVLAPFLFSGGMRQALHLVKYQGRRRLARHLAHHLAAFARRQLRDLPLSVVLPVPLHWQRLWRRGFNQAEWFAQPVADELGLPMVSSWLVRRRATPTQITLSRRARLANLAGAFAVTARATGLADAHALLVDDILTTGATTEACARLLREAGAATVTILAVARTPLDP